MGEGPGEREQAEEILEFYRVDTWRAVVRAFVQGGALITAGFLVLVIAVAFEPRIHPALYWALFVLAVAAIPAGPIVVLRRLLSTIRLDDYLALRRDGVVFFHGPTREEATWDELERVSWDDALACIRMDRRDGDPWLLRQQWAGIDPRTLAKRLDDMRRKAGFNLLPRAG